MEYCGVKAVIEVFAMLSVAYLTEHSLGFPRLSDFCLFLFLHCSLVLCIW